MTGRKHFPLQIYIDGAARGNPGPAGAGAVIQDGEGKILHELCEFLGTCTNNVAEYRSLQLALNKSLELEAEEIHIYSDSQLLVRQVLGHYRVREPKLQKLWSDSQKMLKKFKKYTLTHVPRERNKTADRLANQAIDSRSFESRKAGESLHPGYFPDGEEIPDSTGHDGL